MYSLFKAQSTVAEIVVLLYTAAVDDEDAVVLHAAPLSLAAFRNQVLVK
jgi:hypothetical protein